MSYTGDYKEPARAGHWPSPACGQSGCSKRSRHTEG